MKGFMAIPSCFYATFKETTKISMVKVTANSFKNAEMKTRNALVLKCPLEIDSLYYTDYQI
jgi:hypothetical protein